jgi:hypothetical protein
MALSLYRGPALERRKLMLLSSWRRNWISAAPTARRRTRASPRQRASFRPRLEAVEDRCLPSTLTVTSTSDSGSGSLRAEIAAAQSGDTIVFSPTLSSSSSSNSHHGGTTSTPATITLTSGELDLTKNLTIQGPGAGQLTISGAGSTSTTQHGQKTTTTTRSRVFEIAQNVTVTLSGLTISNGNGLASSSSVAPGDNHGGGILNQGTLTVSSCTVSGNSATYGGGIYNAGGTVTVSSSTLSGNMASEGGGIYNGGGTVAVSGSTLLGNQADDGGAIFNDGTLMVSGCTVSSNVAYYGGGIWNSGTATVSSSTLSDNAAKPTVQSYPFFNEGGGIFNHGTLVLSGCTVTGNFSEYEGGGIFSDGTVTVKNSSSIAGNTISADTASGYAAEDLDNLGVLYLDSTSTIGILDGNLPLLLG